MKWLLIRGAAPILSVAVFTAFLSGPDARAADTSSLPAEPWGKDKAPQCVVCHSLEKGGPFRSAPNLWGIVGADKARHDWFGYSAALKKEEGTWTEEALDEYFKGPLVAVPGTLKTMVPIHDQQARAELIDFLKTLKD